MHEVAEVLMVVPGPPPSGFEILWGMPSDASLDEFAAVLEWVRRIRPGRPLTIVYRWPRHERRIEP